MSYKNKMYCKGCWGDLSGAATRECPACGRSFNPRLYYTYAPGPGNRFPVQLWFLVAIQTAILVLFFGGLSLPEIFGTTQESYDSYEGLGMLMLAAAIGFQAIPVFYGLSIAAFQYDTVVGYRRFCLLALSLIPTLLGASLFILFIMLP